MSIFFKATCCDCGHKQKVRYFTRQNGRKREESYCPAEMVCDKCGSSQPPIRYDEDLSAKQDGSFMVSKPMTLHFEVLCDDCGRTNDLHEIPLTEDMECPYCKAKFSNPFSGESK